MASMPQQRYRKTAKNGEERSMVSKTSVDSEGTFHCTFDSDLEQNVRARLEANTRITCTNAGTLRVSGPDLQKCRFVIGQALEDWMQCEVSEEVVIRYAYDTEASYWKMPSGNIYANGYDCRNDEEYDKKAERIDRTNGDWAHKNTAMAKHRGYSVTLFAKVEKKTTYTRGDGLTDRVRLA